jgi:hypothetical protein
MAGLWQALRPASSGSGHRQKPTGGAVYSAPLGRFNNTQTVLAAASTAAAAAAATTATGVHNGFASVRQLVHVRSQAGASSRTLLVGAIFRHISSAGRICGSAAAATTAATATAALGVCAAAERDRKRSGKYENLLHCRTSS